MPTRKQEYKTSSKPIFLTKNTLTFNSFKHLIYELFEVPNL